MAISSTVAKAGPRNPNQRPPFEASVTMAAELYREAREIRANAGGRIARGDEIADDGHRAGAGANDLRRGLQRHAANRHERHAPLARTRCGAANGFETEARVAGRLGIRTEHRADRDIAHRQVKGRLQLV